MKRMALFAAISAAVSLAIAAALSVGGASGAVTSGGSGQHPGGHNQRILGTWLIDVTPNDDEPFQAMVTFSPGGGLVETESPVPGTGLGSWQSLGRRTCRSARPSAAASPWNHPAAPRTSARSSRRWRS